MSRPETDPRVGDNARRLRDLQADVERLEAELAGLRAAVRASFTRIWQSRSNASAKALVKCSGMC